MKGIQPFNIFTILGIHFRMNYTYSKKISLWYELVYDVYILDVKV